jgi:HEAT repeat protein
VLQEALLDQAAVVRAEAASALGRLYEHTANPAVVRVLTGAYSNSRNWRHGKPLFVQQRILYALHQIGGAAALEAGAMLAGNEKAAVTYWHQLDQSKAW